MIGAYHACVHNLGLQVRFWPPVHRLTATQNAKYCILCSYATAVFTVMLGTCVVWAKGDSNPHVWAEIEARKQLEAEGVI
jgi:hypothetical protein